MTVIYLLQQLYCRIIILLFYCVFPLLLQISAFFLHYVQFVKFFQGIFDICLDLTLTEHLNQKCELVFYTLRKVWDPKTR